MGLLNNISSRISPSTVDNLKASIGKHGGISQPNRFAVSFTPPTGSLLNLDVQGLLTSALTGNFSVNDLFNDPRDINILCENVQLPGRVFTTIEYDAYSRTPRKIPVRAVDEDVTMSFLLTNDYYMKKMFDKWLELVVPIDTHLLRYPSEYQTDIIIQQLDKNNVPVYGIKLINAYPLSVNSVELNNETTDAKHSLNVTFAFDNYIVEGSIKTIISSITDKFSILKKLI